MEAQLYQPFLRVLLEPLVQNLYLNTEILGLSSKDGPVNG